MNELPKELTKELLSDVLGQKVEWLRPNKYGYGIVEYYSQDMPDDCPLNLDELTRLMKQWLVKQSCTIGIYYENGKIEIEVSHKEYRASSYIEDTELEAVLKVTQWVRSKK